MSAMHIETHRLGVSRAEQRLALLMFGQIQALFAADVPSRRISDARTHDAFTVDKCSDHGRLAAARVRGEIPIEVFKNVIPIFRAGARCARRKCVNDELRRDVATADSARTIGNHHQAT